MPPQALKRRSAALPAHQAAGLAVQAPPNEADAAELAEAVQCEISPLAAPLQRGAAQVGGVVGWGGAAQRQGEPGTAQGRRLLHPRCWQAPG